VQLVLIVAAVAGAVFFTVLFDLTGRWKKKRRGS
jgi:hypothetical protein